MVETTALLMIVMVAVEDMVATGVNVALNEAVAEGDSTSGSTGKFVNVKKEPAIVMEVTVNGLVPELEMVTVCVEDCVIGTLPKETGFGVTVMPIDADVTVNPLFKDAVSLPVVTVTVRTPAAAPESIFKIAVALVEDVTVREAVVMPAPKVA